MEEKTHTKSIVEISREGDFRYLLSYRSKLLPWGGGGGWAVAGGDRGVGGNYVVVFQASLICVLNIVPMP